MKKQFLLLILLAFTFIVRSQITANELIRIHSFDNATILNNVNNPLSASFAYRSDNNSIYYFNGLTWVRLLTSPNILFLDNID
jgi:hypothetical protein